jgi:hypothetical protein
LALWIYSHLSKKKLFPKSNIKKGKKVRPVGIDSGVTSASGVEPEQVAQQVVASPSSARSQHRFSTGWVVTSNEGESIELEERPAVASRQGMSSISLLTEKG